MEIRIQSLQDRNKVIIFRKFWQHLATYGPHRPRDLPGRVKIVMQRRVASGAKVVQNTDRNVTREVFLR